MDIVDSEGNLFGLINLIDAVVLLIVCVTILTTVAFFIQEGQVSASSGQSTEMNTTTVILRVQNQPGYVVEAVKEGPVPADDIVSVNDVTARQTKNNYLLRLQVTLNTTRNSEGIILFRNGELYVGSKLTLNLGQTRVKGTVTEISGQERTLTPFQTATPTPTATPTATATPTPTTEPKVIEFRTTGQPQYVVDSISTGTVPAESIVAIKSKSVEKESAINTTATTYTVTLEVELKVQSYLSKPQQLMYEGKRLYVGRELRLDLGETIINGVVTEL